MAIKVETACPPFNIRCRWLVGKLILKFLVHSNHNKFDTYYSISVTWLIVIFLNKCLSSQLKSTLYLTFANMLKNLINLKFMSKITPLSLLPLSFKSKTSLNCLILSLNQCLIIWLVNIFQISSILILPTSQSSILPAQFHQYQLDILSTYLNYTSSFSKNVPFSSTSYTAECYAILWAIIF